MPETTTEPPAIPRQRRDEHLDWLKTITTIPTAAGHERRVVAWVERWLGERPELATRTDAHGNIEIRDTRAPDTGAPIYFTAHLDHPAFVVERRISDTEIVCSFRGGVMSDYFPDAAIRVHHADDAWTPARVIGAVDPDGDEWSETDARAFKLYRCALDAPRPVEPGTIATWDLPGPGVVDDEFGGILHTDACDDLAAVAAALAALDELRRADPPTDTRVLLTRAEEVGFIGAIGASRDRFMPERSRLIALENSRAFPDAPIHGGPIVRVGDRVSVFSPELTGAVAQVAQRISGGPATPKASQKRSEMPAWRWQRKLMAGGACEASVFCAMGYQATCVCLPLGNYHNMADLTEVQAGSFGGTPRVGREHIGLDDFGGMVDLLVACGGGLPDSPSFAQRLESLWDTHRFVLDG